MRSLIKTVILASLVLGLDSCYKCYECKVDTEFGEVTRDVCGRNREIGSLIQALEADTTGNGPWVCD